MKTRQNWSNVTQTTNNGLACRLPRGLWGLINQLNICLNCTPSWSPTQPSKTTNVGWSSKAWGALLNVFGTSHFLDFTYYTIVFELLRFLWSVMRLSDLYLSRASTMLRIYAFRSLHFRAFPGQFTFFQNSRAYSSPSRDTDDEKELDVAREWFSNFNKHAIPESISKTTYTRASGSGGQKTNKFVHQLHCDYIALLMAIRTSSKANTTWALSALKDHVPKILIPELRDCRYYVASSDVIAIQCDAHRSRTQNKTETHDKLHEEIKRLYSQRVPGVTSPEQKAKIDQL